MSQLRAISFVAAIVLTAGCATRAGQAGAAPLPVRILSSEPGRAPEPLPGDAVQAGESALPRIGAPGGSGAGSRRVAPLVQSGNETVGDLPAGSGSGAGVAGRG